MELSFVMTDAFFMEGVVTLLLGFLLLLGSGGINRWTMEAILKSSVADWLYKKETNKEHVRPSEIWHADIWKPKGFPRVGLVCIFAGLVMILIYFLALVV